MIVTTERSRFYVVNAIKEYEAQPFIQKHDLLKYIVDVGLAKLEINNAWLSPVHITMSFIDGQS